MEELKCVKYRHSLWPDIRTGRIAHLITKMTFIAHFNLFIHDLLEGVEEIDAYDIAFVACWHVPFEIDCGDSAIKNQSKKIVQKQDGPLRKVSS
jgi:hypothetical protein